MKTLITAALLSLGLMAGAVHASGAEAKCEAQAAEKKLTGAAKNSFMKKCVTDAGGTPAAAAPAQAKAPDRAEMCEKSAADKKLAGAAKNAHVKKCMEDAKAAAPKK
ncbi:MAG: hypothetical protein LW862_15735 [Rubrivivax sp.]|jgi:hypothetical protein|nr:hypothetical protein [Rubrivivax sp.]